MDGPGQLAYLLIAYAFEFLAPAKRDARRLTRQGLLYERAGRLVSAEKRFRASLDRSHVCWGGEDRRLVPPLYHLVRICEAQAKYDDAVGYCRQLLDLQDKLDPDKEEEKLWAVESLARLLHHMNRIEESAAIYERLVTGLQVARGPRHVDVGSALHWHGCMLDASEKGLEALESFRRALEIQQEQLEPRDPNLRTTRRSIAVSLHRQGNQTDAERIYRELLALEEQSSPDRGTADTMQGLGEVLFAQGRYLEAEESFHRCLATLERLGRGLRPEAIRAAAWLGHVLVEQDKKEEAVRCYQRVLSPNSTGDQINTEHLVCTLDNLGQLFEKLNRKNEAEECYRRLLGVDHASMSSEVRGDLIDGLENYAALLEQSGRAEEVRVVRLKAEEIRVSSAAPRA